MNEIISLLDNSNTLINSDNTYVHNGVKVPRVTKILQRCISNDGLMYWANSLGFRHKSYSKTLKNAANIGTFCHNSIDLFLDDNKYEANPNMMPYESFNAYQSFLQWYNDISLTNNVEVIYHEKTLTCKYFGGTLDGLYKINGKIYLIDYKTSNHININYALQLAAYRYMLKEELNIDIDGCIILQLAKNEIGFNEYYMDLSNPIHLEYMNHFQQTFLSLVYSYYNLCKTEEYFKNLKWG